MLQPRRTLPCLLILLALLLVVCSATAHADGTEPTPPPSATTYLANCGGYIVAVTQAQYYAILGLWYYWEAFGQLFGAAPPNCAPA